jgi:hypothetical protein
MFDLYDYLSLYLSDWQRLWIGSTYIQSPERFERFKELCVATKNVTITPNAVMVSKYLLDVHEIVCFPHIVITRSQEKGVGKWELRTLHGDTHIRSSVPLTTVVERIHSGMSITVTPHLDNCFYEITL